MELILHLFAFLQNYLIAILCAVMHYIYREKPAVIPPAQDCILNMSGATLAKKIRDRELTCQTVVRTFIERIKETNSFVNAVVEDRYEAAMNEAKACDEKLERGELTAWLLEKEKPLYGVPFTVKESCAVKGLSHTGCTLVRQGIKAHADSDVVQILRDAGGIPLCVTNTPESCTGYDTHNFMVGRTKNPYDGRRTAGGSSGGEGALLGAGASVIGLGSDMAGSIRLPALFNGVFGHKPTTGLISNRGHYPMSETSTFKDYLCLGPLTRYAEDLKLIMKILTRKSSVDLRLNEPVDVRKLKVFYLEDAGDRLGLIPTSPDIRESIKKAAQYLENRGANISRFPFPMNDTADIAGSMLFGMEDIPQILIDPDNPKEEKVAVFELFKSFFGLSQYTKTLIISKLMLELNGLISSTNMPLYLAQGAVLKEKLISLLGDDGVFFYPTFPHAASFRNIVTLEVMAAMYCVLWNGFGFPSTNVPMGLNKDGLPVGFQVIAAPNQDRLCLAVAKELETGFGGWVPPPTTS